MHAYLLSKNSKIVNYLRYFVLCVSLAGCVHTAAGPKGVAAEPSGYGQGSIERPLLWTAAKGGKTAYLFGTVHIGVDAESELPATVWQAFRASSCFVMEADQDSVDPSALVSMAMLPAGETLAARLTPATWAKVQSELQGKLPRTLLEHSQPWFVSILYLQQQLPKGKPMDGVFQAQAKAANKRIEYLEDWRSALGAFASVTTKDDLEDLVQHEDEADRQTEALVRAYRSGDEAKVQQVVDEINKDTPNAAEKTKVLIDGRNAAWMPRLVASAQGGGCFVAVGAGHLVGKGNLRERLAKDGWTIKRVTGP